MTHQRRKTWILVAHGSGAIVYESRGPRLPLVRLMQFENPLGRLRPGQLESDRPGRAFDRHGNGRHAMSKEETSTERVAHDFAQRMVDRLEHARAAGAFDRLALIAPPKLLGKLRRELSEPSRALLIASIAKDLVHSDPEQVRYHLDGLAFV